MFGRGVVRPRSRLSFHGQRTSGFGERPATWKSALQRLWFWSWEGPAGTSAVGLFFCVKRMLRGHKGRLERRWPVDQGPGSVGWCSCRTGGGSFRRHTFEFCSVWPLGTATDTVQLPSVTLQRRRLPLNQRLRSSHRGAGCTRPQKLFFFLVYSEGQLCVGRLFPPRSCNCLRRKERCRFRVAGGR